MEEYTFEREMYALKSANDNYINTVIMLDRFTLGNYGGINVAKASDLALKKLRLLLLNLTSLKLCMFYKN